MRAPLGRERCAILLAAFGAASGFVACGDGDDAPAAVSTPSEDGGGAGPGDAPDGTDASADVSHPDVMSQPDAGPLLKPPMRFALIGDYGFDSEAESSVAQLVLIEEPEFVVTLGDNNYPDGLASTIDENIGKYYSSFIFPYSGAYGAGATENRFWPCLGNHDWNSGTMKPYADYFTLPGNERYWDLVKGSIQFVCLDSDPHEPDGRTPASVQGQWFAGVMGASTTPFRFVLMHHPPYSSGFHGNLATMQWGYAQAGADVVLAGHDHDYERLEQDGIPYVVQGLGGAGLRDMSTSKPQSVFTFNDAHGATFARADDHFVVFETKTVARDLIDVFAVASQKDATLARRALVAAGATWAYKDDGVAPDALWLDPAFSQDGWKSGPASLGYGHVGLKTTVSFGGNATQKHITTYFRHTFEVDRVDDVAWVALQVVKDDGAAVYLNGVEVLRTNLPKGPLAPNTAARYRVGYVAETAWEPVTVEASLLKKGTNVLSVELHQVAASSSDAIFDLKMEAVLK